MGPTAMGRIFSVLQATSVATLAAADAAATLTRTATMGTVAAIAEDLMRHCPDETACIFFVMPWLVHSQGRSFSAFFLSASSADSNHMLFGPLFVMCSLLCI